MKKNKLWLFLSIFAVALLVLAACGDGNGDDTGGDAETGDNGNGDVVADEFGLDENGRFVEQRTISVALWDRNDERIPNFDESYWAEWVAEQMLEQRNVVVEWETVPRWPNDYEHQSMLLAAGDAADVGATFNNAMITTMAEMGGIHNLYDHLPRYRDLLPNLYGLLGNNVYHNFDPVTETLWTLAGWNNNANNGRTSVWIREDWLAALDLEIPTTMDEFADTLRAFRDRADELPGVGEIGEFYIPSGEEDVEGVWEEFLMTADDVIPYLITQDVGWDATAIFESFIPSDITEREWFVRGFDDRRFMFEDAMREGARVLNQWYYEGLIFDDFAITDTRDAQDRIRLGHVGATIANWDMPFRGGDAWTTRMRENVGEDAMFIPITPFLNDVGEVQQFVPNPTDRFIFFPSTNDEILASFLYLDFMSSPDTVRYLQIGREGLHHEILEDGAISMLSQEDMEGRYVQPSGMNFDITLTVNNLGAWQFGGDEDVAVGTLSRAYPGIDPERVLHAREIGTMNNIMFRNVNVPHIAAEDGMSAVLADLRNLILHRVIANVHPDDFDEAWAAEYQVYLDTGGRAIMEEREQAWIDTFGDVDIMPDLDQ
ncbi:MAG: hypothetical protein FWE07_04425 [Turicibacter sp.]|nr:hypothetical protein [Turicibacter sp.]